MNMRIPKPFHRRRVRWVINSPIIGAKKSSMRYGRLGKDFLGTRGAAMRRLAFAPGDSAAACVTNLFSK